MTDQGYLRRQPRQARSLQRVHAILDAAECVFSEVGFTAASTNAIAARADTNIASLYQYFPNKEAILAGVVARYRSEYDALADIIFAPQYAQLPISELVARMSSATVDLHLQHGVVRPFFVGVGETSSEFGPLEMEVYGGVLHKADQAMTVRMPILSAAQRQVTLKVILRVMQAVIALVDVPQGANKQSIIEAVRVMIGAYLDSLTNGMDSFSTKENEHDGSRSTHAPEPPVSQSAPVARVVQQPH